MSALATPKPSFSETGRWGTLKALRCIRTTWTDAGTFERGTAPKNKIARGNPRAMGEAAK
jgi:hypothetical protein